MKKNLAIYIAIVVMTLSLAALPNQAQTLDDWKEALRASQNNKGCESIPYDSYRDKCQDKHDEIDEWCKTEKWSCQNLLETKSLRENIKGLTEHIKNLKTEKDQLNSQKSSAGSEDEKNQIGKKIEEVEKKIYDKEKALYEMEKSLSTDLSDIDKRLYQADKCLDAREDVYEIFEDVISKAKSESNPDIKAIANQLISYWEKGNKAHEQAIKDVEAGTKYCEKCKSGDYE